IDFHAEHPIAVAMNYGSGTLQVTMRDTVTGATQMQTYNVDIPSHVGGDTAYVGFTAGTGGLTSFQDILRWVYAPSSGTGLTAPSLVVANAISGTQATVSWTDSGTGETGFKIKRRTDTDGYTVVGTVDADTLTFTDSGLDLGTTYYYRVAATDGAEDSADSLEASVTIPSIPAKTSDARATRIAPRQIDLAWTDNANNEDGYKIFRRTGDGTFDLIATLPPDTETYRDRGLQPDTVYDYHIQAFNISGFADFSGVTVTTPPIVLPSGCEDTAIGNPPK